MQATQPRQPSEPGTSTSAEEDMLEDTPSNTFKNATVIFADHTKTPFAAVAIHSNGVLTVSSEKTISAPGPEALDPAILTESTYYNSSAWIAVQPQPGGAVLAHVTPEAADKDPWSQWVGTDILRDDVAQHVKDWIAERFAACDPRVTDFDTAVGEPITVFETEGARHTIEGTVKFEYLTR